MKKIILITISFFLLVACGTSKKIQSTNQQTESNFSQEKIKEHEERNEAIITTVSGSLINEDVTIVTEEFDTDKPTDPETGTPPLKRRTTESRNTQQQEQQSKTEEQTNETKNTEKEQTDQQNQEANIIKITDKKGLNQVQRVFIGIGIGVVVLAVLFLCFYLFKNKLNPIKKIFKHG